MSASTSASQRAAARQSTASAPAVAEAIRRACFAVSPRKSSPIAPKRVGLTFGESEWARRFKSFGFSPALSFYSPSGVGQILPHIGDCPYDSFGAGVNTGRP